MQAQRPESGSGCGTVVICGLCTCQPADELMAKGKEKPTKEGLCPVGGRISAPGSPPSPRQASATLASPPRSGELLAGGQTGLRSVFPEAHLLGHKRTCVPRTPHSSCGHFLAPLQELAHHA